MTYRSHAGSTREIMLGTKTYFGLASLPTLYSRLFEEAGQESFFLTLPWFLNFEKTVLARDEVVEIIGVERKDQNNMPIGALVLKVKKRRSGLSPLNIDSLTNYYTSYFAPALAHDCKELKSVAGMFAHEIHSRKGVWDVLNVRPVDLSSPAIRHFRFALEDLGIRTQPYFCFGNWYLNVGGRSYAEYFKGLPSVVRKNVPYHKRRLERFARSKILTYEGTDHLESCIRDYEAVYNSSWRNAEGYPNFIRGLIRIAAENGWLRLGVLYVDDEPAAAQLWIVHAGVASIYKIGYAEKFAKWSVGSILTAHLLEYVLDVDQVKEVDYLTGDDAYKANWMSDRRERWGIMAFNGRTLWGKAGFVRHIGGKALKSRWQSFSRELINYWG
jgi:Acetyltransferase (GNAT) domain